MLSNLKLAYQFKLRKPGEPQASAVRLSDYLRDRLLSVIWPERLALPASKLRLALLMISNTSWYESIRIAKLAKTRCAYLRSILNKPVDQTISLI